MERIRSFSPRRYNHACPANHKKIEQLQSKVCPACGQEGEFAGFFQGIPDRMARKTKLLGFPCSGVHMTFLPKLTRLCERCHGEGIALGEGFDYECTDCDGTGGFLIHNEEEMRKVRRWALARLKRFIEERRKPIKTSPRLTPSSPIFSQDIDAFIHAFMAMVNYTKKFGERNHRIGELVLRCDDHGWDVFMEMVEIWENSGGGFKATQEDIQFKASNRKNAVTLLSLYPPSEQQPQRLLLDRVNIRRKLGVRAEREIWDWLSGFTRRIDGWINVDDSVSIDEGRKLVSLLTTAQA